MTPWRSWRRSSWDSCCRTWGRRPRHHSRPVLGEARTCGRNADNGIHRPACFSPPFVFSSYHILYGGEATAVAMTGGLPPGFRIKCGMTGMRAHGTTLAKAEPVSAPQAFFRESLTRPTTRRCSAIRESGSSLPVSPQGLPRPMSLAMIL